MATGFASKTARKTASRPEPAEGPRPYLLTVKQFEAMIGAGVFAEGEHVELLGGELIQKMTKYPPHNFGVDSSATLLRSILPAVWIVREEKAINLDDSSRPEPDLVVAQGPREMYRLSDPFPKDIALIVEVADASYSEDRIKKWVRYAAAKVPVYVILNIGERRLELYRKPYGRGATARYRESLVFDESAEMPVIIEGVEVGRIAVRDVLA